MGYRWAAAGRRQGRKLLGVALAGFVTASVSLVGPTVARSPAQAAPVVSAPTTQLAILRQITGMSFPGSIGVNSADDTVYVGSLGASELHVINGKTGTLDDTLPFGAPYNSGSINGVAVNEVDDTVYVNIATGGGGANGLALLSGQNPRDDSTVVSVVAGMGGIAVDALDNRVVTADGRNPSNVYRFNGSDGSTAGSDVSLGSAGFQSVAMNVSDDTVYASGSQFYPEVKVIDGQTWAVVGSIPKGAGGGGGDDIAVNQADDTVYALNRDNNTMSVIDGRTGTLTDDTVAVGRIPVGVAVDQRDDTVYVTNADYLVTGAESLSVIDGRTATRTDDTIAFGVGSYPYDVAVDDTGPNGGLVYVSLRTAPGLAVIGRVTPTIWPPAAPVGNIVTLTLDVPQVAYDVDNTTVTTVYFDDTAVTPTAGAGDTWTVTVPPGTGTNVPVTVKLRGGLYASAGTFTFGTTTPSEPILNTAVGGNASIDIAWTEIFDGGTPVTTVWYAINGYTRRSLGTLVSPATITADSSGAPLAPGTSYTVRIQVENARGSSNWSNVLTATTNSNPTPPAPPVTYPPGPPTNAAAEAGDADAAVSWSAPADSGSFPITDYEVKASPGGASCLVKVPDTKCTVDGLSNGTAYTFEVRALNGAGWGPWSTASDPVTPLGPKPTPTIVITGSRGAGADVGRVFADGVTTHLVGEQVQARVHLSGQVNYENGSVRTVASNGTFRWQRQTKKTVYVYFRVVDEPGVRSNRLVIRLDRP